MELFIFDRHNSEEHDELNITTIDSPAKQIEPDVYYNYDEEDENNDIYEVNPELEFLLNLKYSFINLFAYTKEKLSDFTHDLPGMIKSGFIHGITRHRGLMCSVCMLLCSLYFFVCTIFMTSDAESLDVETVVNQDNRVLEYSTLIQEVTIEYAGDENKENNKNDSKRSFNSNVINNSTIDFVGQVIKTGDRHGIAIAIIPITWTNKGATARSFDGSVVADVYQGSRLLEDCTSLRKEDSLKYHNGFESYNVEPGHSITIYKVVTLVTNDPLEIRFHSPVYFNEDTNPYVVML